MNTISYGIGRDYLSSWGLGEALREIFQNYIDYGYYEVYKEDIENGLLYIEVTNDYIPNSLEFLKIGKSIKNNKSSIGKHGEGLKMAFLVFLREGLSIKIETNTKIITPKFEEEFEIGEVLKIDYKEKENNDDEIPDDRFKTCFYIKKDIFESFLEGIIEEKDIVFKNEYGSIVNKKKGNIYSNGLFVCHLDKFTKSYDIKPEYMPLDRDREVPRQFDVNWYSSRILEDYGKFTSQDLGYSDTEYISKVPKSIIENTRAVRVGNNVELVVKEKDEKGNITDKVIPEGSIKDSLRKNSIFSKIINKIKHTILKNIGIYDLLLKFQEEHQYNLTSKGREDLSIIIERFKDEK